MIDAPTMFSTKPVRIIAAATIFPLLKTTALGAVATGNMNAQLALKAAGTINNSGAIEAPIAAAASTGISNVVVAVLLVVSRDLSKAAAVCGPATLCILAQAAPDFMQL